MPHCIKANVSGVIARDGMATGDKSNMMESAISRRAAMAGLAAVAASGVPEARAEAVQTLPMPEDERLMREAIALAAEGDFPFGAVITRDGQILARGKNLGKQTHDPTAHGEMVAIRQFLAEHGPEQLKGTVLYTSGEPCVMCMGAIAWCKIARVVYAASVPEIGKYMGQIGISCTEVAERTPFEKIEITGGVLAEEALKLFKS
jgi:tRNA(Arg) A34 adenosine deaminase TadA